MYSAAIFEMPHIGKNTNISSKVGYFELLEHTVAILTW
jgi:hypothetical protein